MPKVARVAKFRTASVQASPSLLTAKQVSEPAKIPEATDETNLSRGQRKRLAKREQYLRKEKIVLSSLTLRHQDEQKKRIDGLDAIKEALLSTVSPIQDEPKISDLSKIKPNLMISNKSKKSLVAREVSQMSLVLQHPAFQADPFATIREHLKNTLAKDERQQKKEEIQHQKERVKIAEEKKIAKKKSGAKRKRKKFKATRSRAK
jgi:ABC-type dipeptide/oligopeptide/nickel transport system ATPase component